MPRRWWRKQAPASDKLCYRSKVDALLAFADWNRDVIENYGGMGYEVSPQEFDAINWKYDLRTPGKRRVKSIAEALWVAMPPGKPFCLDRIDLDALNDSSPGREHDVGFQVPDYVLESRDQDWSWYRERELEPVPF